MAERIRAGLSMLKSLRDRERRGRDEVARTGPSLDVYEKFLKYQSTITTCESPAGTPSSRASDEIISEPLNTIPPRCGQRYASDPLPASCADHNKPPCPRPDQDLGCFYFVERLIYCGIRMRQVARRVNSHKVVNFNYHFSCRIVAAGRGGGE